MHKLDDIDLQILKLLQEDGRMSNVEISAQVGLSAPPCLRRIRALEDIDPRGERFQGTPHPLHNFFGLYTGPQRPECLKYRHPDSTIALTVFWAMPLRAPCHPE